MKGVAVAYTLPVHETEVIPPLHALERFSGSDSQYGTDDALQLRDF